MAFLQCLCLVLATLYGVCHAQSIIRTLMPSMAIMEYPSGSSPSSEDSSASSADDLGALLLLARALEMDRANNANNGIDVNGLLNTLIHALVFTATYDSGSSSGGNGYTSNFSRGAAPNSNMGRMGNSAGNTGHSGDSDGSKGSGGLGLPATLKGVTGAVGGLLGGGEGGTGVTGLLDGVTNTVGGLLGGDGSGGDMGGLLGL